MMYNNKMALAVKANSRVLREIEDAVYIPFGSEYSLLIKNLNSVKALVRVWIDGTDVTDGSSLVVQPNSSIDLERFIKNGNMDAGNKFKFIERTANISAHRGNKVDDGLIRVEFEFEVPTPKRIINTTTWYTKSRYPYDEYYTNLVGSPMFTGAVGGSLTNSVGGRAGDFMSKGGDNMSAELNVAYASAQGATKSSPLRSRSPQSDVGITVAGGISDQKFTEAGWFPTDGVKHVMVLRVLGDIEGEPVKAPVTVKTKPTCASCGRTNKAGSKYCTECGTGLQIV